MVKHLPEAPSWPYIFAVELDIVGWNASVSSPGISKIGRQKKKRVSKKSTNYKNESC
jgi:hypothetical protein